MKMIRFICVVAATVFLQPVFANDYEDSMSNDRPCGMIAKSCLDAGYARENPNKKFWNDCMKPLLLGKTVEGVTLKSDVIKKCRTDKINEMKKELKEFQNSRFQ